jgi:predicted dehydrogenase
MTEYRVAIIGCGRQGPRRGGAYGIAEAHARAYEAVGITKIVAAADVSEENLTIFCDNHNIPGRYLDYHEMLAKEKPDIVSICTWPQLHAEMAVAAANAGVKGILCEKPMALSLPDCDAMIAACEKNNTKLSIDHQRRLGEPFKVAKEIAYSGAIGDLYRVESYVGGSTLLDWGTHWVDMMFFFLNETPVEWVAAQIDARGNESNWALPREDHTLMHVQFQNGVRGYMEIGVPVKDMKPIRLVGTEGWVEMNQAGEGIPAVQARRKGDTEWYIPGVTGTIHGPDFFIRSVRDLVQAIEENRQSELSGRRARATTEVLLAAYESALRGGKVYLPLKSTDFPLYRLMEYQKQQTPA